MEDVGTILRAQGINAARRSLRRCRQIRKAMETDMNRLREDEIVQENDGTLSAGDGIDRRNFLGCMAWAGTGLLWTIAGGVPAARVFALGANGAGAAGG